MSYALKVSMNPLRNIGRVLLVIAIVIGCCLTTAGESLAINFRKVIAYGEQAPGMEDGVVFSNPALPVINNAGQVAFWGQVHNTSNDKALWSEGGGSGLEMIARRGQLAPGAPTGVNFQGFREHEIMLNDAGEMTFLSEVRVDQFHPLTQGLWTKKPGEPISKIALAGEVPPGFDPGMIYQYFSNWTLSNSGHVLFGADVYDANISDRLDDAGVWSNLDGSNVHLIAKKGDPAPGFGPDVTFHTTFPVALNSTGQTIFSGQIRGPGIDWQENDIAIALREPHSAPQLLLQKETPDYTLVDNPDLVGGSFSHLNDNGDFGGWGSVTGTSVDYDNNEAILVNRGAGMTMVMREGDQVPGMPVGTNFSFEATVTDIDMNNSGHFAFARDMQGPEIEVCQSVGIWTQVNDNDLELVAQSGMQAPGAPDGVVFDYFTTRKLALEFNDAGQVAFFAYLQGPGVDGSSDSGICMKDPSGELRAVVLEGSEIEIAPGEFRTIHNLKYGFDPANRRVRTAGFNNRGEVAFVAHYDGGVGVFVSEPTVVVPEPSTYVMAGMGLLGLGFIANRRKGDRRRKRA